MLLKNYNGGLNHKMSMKYTTNNKICNCRCNLKLWIIVDLLHVITLEDLNLPHIKTWDNYFKVIF